MATHSTFWYCHILTPHYTTPHHLTSLTNYKGYVALGYVATEGIGQKPNADVIWCVHASLVAVMTFNGNEKGPCVWADRRSGARGPISLWNVARSDLLPPSEDLAPPQQSQQPQQPQQPQQQGAKEKEGEEDFVIVNAGDEQVVRISTWVAVEGYDPPFFKSFCLYRDTLNTSKQ